MDLIPLSLHFKALPCPFYYPVSAEINIRMVLRVAADKYK